MKGPSPRQCSRMVQLCLWEGTDDLFVGALSLFYLPIRVFFVATYPKSNLQH